MLLYPLFCFVTCSIPVPLPDLLQRHYGEEIVIPADVGFIEKHTYTSEHIKYSIELDGEKSHSNLQPIKNKATYKVVEIDSYLFRWGGNLCDLRLKDVTKKYPDIWMKCKQFRFYQDYFNQITKAISLLKKQKEIYIYPFSYRESNNGRFEIKLDVYHGKYILSKMRKVTSIKDIGFEDWYLSAFSETSVFVSGEKLKVQSREGGKSGTLGGVVDVRSSNIINICGRGKFGEVIAYHLKTTCDKVNSLEMKKIKKLNVGRSNITQILPGAFKGLEELEDLSISKNEIPTLFQNGFVGLKSLKKLNLYGNDIKNVQGKSFFGLDKLTDLNLGRNQLVETQEKMFIGTPLLEKLSLHSNKIRKVASGTFDAPNSLTEIGLNSNKITSLENDSLKNLNSLKKLNLNSNSLWRVPTKNLLKVPSLESLLMQSNKIRIVNAYAFEGLSKLKILAMTTIVRNRIIHDYAFAGLGSLIYLESSNHVSNITEKTFFGLNSLEELKIGGGGVKSIEAGSFKNLLHLKKMYFGSLNISNVSRTRVGLNPKVVVTGVKVRD